MTGSCFFENMILFPNVVQHKYDIFIKLVSYNDSLISTEDIDGLVL